MRFVSERVKREWFNGVNDPIRLDPLLKQIAEDAEFEAERSYNWEPTITCILRTPAENDALYGNNGTHRDGVHVAGRGIDIRTRDVDLTWADHVQDYLNEMFEYDPERPQLKVAVLEGVGPGSSAPHLHLQSHPRTRLRPA